MSRIWSSNKTRHSRSFLVDSSGNFTLVGGVRPVFALVIALTEFMATEVVLCLGITLGRSNLGRLPRFSLEYTAICARHPATLGHLEMNQTVPDSFLNPKRHVDGRREWPFIECSPQIMA